MAMMPPMIKRAYKTELDPTVEQRRALAQHAAGARVAHNWALERWRELAAARAVCRHLRAREGVDYKGMEAAGWLGYALQALHFGAPVKARTKRGEAQRYRYRGVPGSVIPDVTPTAESLHAILVFMKGEQPERFGWFDELSAFVIREAVGDVGDGWKHFFEHLKAGRYDRAGTPLFRSAAKRQHYHADQPTPIRVTEKAILIPGVGWVRLKERGYLPTTLEKSHHFVRGGKAFGLGLSEHAGRWRVALRCEVPRPMPHKRGPGRALRDHPVPRVRGKTIGVEVGVRHFVVTSDGSVDLQGLRAEKRLMMLERKRKIWERRANRRYKAGKKRREQSRGWQEAKKKIALYHARATDVRDYISSLAARRVVDTGAETVVLRAPFVHAMKSRGAKTGEKKFRRDRCAPDVHIARMGDVRRRIEYKQAWAGGNVVLAPNEFPSTKRCSACGHTLPDDPGFPDFRCPACRLVKDRERNSADNLLQFATEEVPRAAE